MNKQSHRLVFSRAPGFALTAVALASQAQGLPGGTALTGIAPRPGLAAATVLPTGATVVKGSGTVSVNGADMTINQSSQRLVTDWQSFSIGAGNSVRFVQPSSSSVALNRITGGDPSNIFGSLTANGHVYLENANGVYFAPGAQVSVGSLLATSLSVDVDQFMLGRVRLSGGSEASGEVSNAGTINVAPGGHVVLAAPMVSNTGSITTPGGTTALVAGNAVDIDPTGSGLLSISVPVAAVNARLAQSGSITADGGSVQLAAAATDAALRTVMQVGGVIRARSIEQHDGQILLSGGSSGVVAVDGELDASGGAGAQGGTIKVLGDRVGLTGAARLDASGSDGGGTILVGGNRQGKGPEANATDTFVGSGVVLDASATTQGNGGKVVVWADRTTTYSGQIDARGGSSGGDGGNVEVSGKSLLNFQGGVDLTAPHGKAGNLLLDPQYLTVGTVADVNGDGTTGDDLIANVFSGDPGVNSQITATRLATLLDTSNVTLQSLYGLTVSTPVTVAAGGAATTLSLQSANVTIGAAMNLNNASLTASTTPTFTTQSIVLDAAVQSNGSVSLTSPTVTVNAALTAPTVTMSGGTLSQSSAGTGTVTANTLTLTGGVNTNADFSFSNNAIGTLVLNAGNVNVTAANNPGVPLAVQGTTGGALTLTTTGTSITQSGVLDVSGTFTGTTQGSGDITLPNTSNLFGSSIVFNGAGNVSIFAQGSMNSPSGSAAGDISLSTDGIVHLFGAISGHNIDFSSAGFQEYYGSLTTSAGGRYTIRSSDYTQDYFYGPVTPGSAADAINYVVYGGYTGAAPGTGNGLFTNQTGTIAPPNADNPPISKVYDGTTGFTVAQTGTAAAGVLNAASPVPLTLGAYTVNASGNFSDRNAGTNKGLTVGPSNDTQAVSLTQNGAVLYGLQFAGYTRAAGPHAAGTPGNAVAAITAKPIVSSGVDGVDRVYNATSTVGVNIAGASLSGTIAGDTVNLSAAGATGTMVDKNVGTNKAVTVTGLTLTGADAANYTVTDASAANATITPLAITSHGLTGVDRAYNGLTTVAVNGSGATLAGVLGSDVVSVDTTGATGTMADKNAGNGKAIAIGGVTLGGTDGGNYTVTDASAATVNIARLGITSTGIGGVDRVYNGTTGIALDTSAAGLAGAITGDNVNLVTTGAIGVVGNKNVGTNKAVAVSGLALGGADAGNYTVSDGGGATATITPLSITSHGLTGVDRTYNGTATVAVNGSGGTLTGVLGSDVVTLAAGGATGTMADKNVGTGKPIAIGGLTLGGTDGGNYTVTDASGATVSITPLGITSTGVTGVDRVYDGTTVVGVNAGGAALNGTIAGDNVSLVATGASGSIADKNVGVAKPVTVTGLTLGGTDAANYTLTDASAATATITALGVQATGITAVNRVDNGSTVVGLDTGSAGIAGILPGDTVGIDASGAVGSVATPSPGAAKPVTVTGLVLTGADALDYAVLPTPIGASGGPLTVHILSVTENNFDELRYKEYLQGVADAQEPFRRAMLEALLSGFGKENIRKQLQRGLVFETGLAAPAVDIIESAKPPDSCTPAAGADLSCGR